LPSQIKSSKTGFSIPVEHNLILLILQALTDRNFVSADKLPSGGINILSNKSATPCINLWMG
jgi:hypothetical protein